VNQISAIFSSTGGNIKTMVRAILQPGFLLQANPWRNPKLKRPFHLLAGLLRQLGADPSNPLTLNQALQAMGHAPYDWHAPDGYSDRIEAWGGGVLSRWSLVSRLLEDGFAGVTVGPTEINHLLGGVPRPQVARTLDLLLMGGHMAIKDRMLLQEHVNVMPQWGLAEAREAIALAASSPSYQIY
jgi:uncharacterized protein (DUF1800 family)